MTNDRADSATFSKLASELLAGEIGFRFQAKGRSMIPTIADGDVLHVESANPDSFKVGDIVLFKRGAEFKAHRIIHKHGELFSTRGDAGVDIDEIGRQQIVGKVTARECRQTGRTISIHGPIARAGFFWRELRRQLRNLLTSWGL
jgi:signal peptidase I